jgi:RimJ/RimL family protein N-acetyltransferase
VYDVFADDYARRFYPQMTKLACIGEWIVWSLRHYARHGFGLWAMELKLSGLLLGDCGLTYQEVEGRPRLELGYHVLHAQRRKGFATEAAIACRNYAFDQLCAPDLCSIVDPQNDASRVVAGRVHASCRTFLKGDQPMLLYSSTREEYERLWLGICKE